MTLQVFLIITLLVLVNSLYVAAEFAAVSVRKSRIQQQAEEGKTLAKRFLPFVADARKLDGFVATCQVGITLSSLVVGAYGQTKLAPVLTPYFESWGGMQTVAAQSASAITILVLLTATQMIFGELVPKSLALQFPTAVALFTVIPMEWSVRLLSWFIVVLNGRPLEERLAMVDVTKEEVLTAARSTHGLERMEQIRYAILETSGTISIIPRQSGAGEPR